MARKSKCPPAGPNNGYLISFGDTMTALLAFFIVLNSLAKDQTGANLHTGTGSFVQVLNSFGLDGVFDKERSRLAFQLEAPSPMYMAPNDENREREWKSTGPDKEDSGTRVVDWEEASFHRFLNELERLHDGQTMPEIEGEVAFDRAEPLPKEGPLLDTGMKQMLQEFAPLIRRPNYTVEIVVWATTPAATAWTRAAQQASRLRSEAAAFLRLRPEDQDRFTAVGQPWISKDLERPSVSIRLRKIDPVINDAP
ncbi:flagellar motor protein MotB [Maioricimonas sp. JC845]|uniref:flagellar motor protein MotB n=1 Tax=Maioricimonas sp. JC845 TaxID=3232138 RepID=UPI003459D764